jgi:hypothetical protein
MPCQGDSRTAVTVRCTAGRHGSVAHGGEWRYATCQVQTNGQGMTSSSPLLRQHRNTTARCPDRRQDPCRMDARRSSPHTARLRYGRDRSAPACRVRRCQAYPAPSKSNSHSLESLSPKSKLESARRAVTRSDMGREVGQAMALSGQRWSLSPPRGRSACVLSTADRRAGIRQGKLRPHASSILSDRWSPRTRPGTWSTTAAACETATVERQERSAGPSSARDRLGAESRSADAPSRGSGLRCQLPRPCVCGNSFATT